MLKELQDAQGRAMYDYVQGQDNREVIERDDGLIECSEGPRMYTSTYEDWPEPEKEALRHVRGRVLDIGCGAGRHALYLQEQGLDVLGIDVSPLAIEVAKSRGLRSAQVLPITRVSRRLGQFDTIILFGNNFGLLANARRARWLLRRFHYVTSAQGRIVAQTLDPYQTDRPEHRAYHERNRGRGRMGGQVRMRVRYRQYATPWFDYLFVSPEEMKTLVDGTGWEIVAFIDGEHGSYFAVIDRR